jgi:hypothetical protein
MDAKTRLQEDLKQPELVIVLPENKSIPCGKGHENNRDSIHNDNHWKKAWAVQQTIKNDPVHGELQSH